MKVFVYEVGAFEYRDNVAFGDAWRQAKAKATELHCAIYREVLIDGDVVRREVYLAAGAFVGIGYADADSIKVW